MVKRPVSDVGFSDSLPGTGSKRSVRDRLGSSLDSSQVDNKRCVHLSCSMSVFLVLNLQVLCQLTFFFFLVFDGLFWSF